MKYDQCNNLYHMSWQMGFNAGCCDNSKSNPGERTGEELAAYVEGFEFGELSHNIYLDQRSCDEE
jgi:hypothetical protein